MSMQARLAVGVPIVLAIAGLSFAAQGVAPTVDSVAAARL